jgi:NAD(P)-dependent dehydrogenase (short-subunit alcohol dehydrogenase family)
MTTQQLSGTTAIVTGASRGFGRGIASALAQAGARVVGVARDAGALEEVHGQLGAAFTPVAADAADPVLAGQLIDAYQPRTLVLNAGAAPLTRPVHRHTWQTFSRNWEVDVQHAFHWTREALLAPLEPGSTVIVVSSGAALRGSPLSGGYAGAKAMIRFLASYAAGESRREGLGIRVISVLPDLTPETRMGQAAVAAYAAREGVDAATFNRNRGPALTPDHAGAEITRIITSPGYEEDAYLLGAAGLSPAP